MLSVVVLIYIVLGNAEAQMTAAIDHPPVLTSSYIPDGAIMTDLDGNELTFGQLTAGKFAIVNLWATWCTPCLAEMPSLMALQEKYAASDDLVFCLFRRNLLVIYRHFSKRNWDIPIYSSRSIKKSANANSCDLYQKPRR